MEIEPKQKFTVFAEILPQNERTQKIMAEREAIENQKRAEAEEVRVKIGYNIRVIVEIDEGERRQRQEEEGERLVTGEGKERENGQRLSLKAQRGRGADDQVGRKNDDHGSKH